MSDKKNEMRENDPLQEKFAGIDRMVNAPPKVVEAVKSGVPIAKEGIQYTPGYHVRKFTKVAVAYAVGVILLLGAIWLLPRLYSEESPVATQPDEITLTTIVTTESNSPDSVPETYHPVEPVGQLPEAFREMVESNSLERAVAYRDCWVKTDGGMKMAIRYSRQGVEELRYTVENENAEQRLLLSAAIPTLDGGLLVAVFDSVHEEEGLRAGFTEIIKMNADEEVDWRYRNDSFGWNGVRELYEREDGYYIFGGTDFDIVLMKLSKKGELLVEKQFGGSDYDSFYRAVAIESGFEIFCHCQSKDGDLEGYEPIMPQANSWIITVDLNFNVRLIESVQSLGGYVISKNLGVLDGEIVGPKDLRFYDYDAGTIESVMDYGEQYLIISYNLTGEVPMPPEMSSRHYYTETVYSMFNADGKLIWRTAREGSVR